MDGADFVGLIVTIAVWPTVVVLRGWPLNRIESRVPRLLANNSAVVAGGLLTYCALSASGLPAETINSVCGCVIVGGPLGGAHRRRDTELLGYLHAQDARRGGDDLDDGDQRHEEG